MNRIAIYSIILLSALFLRGTAAQHDLDFYHLGARVGLSQVTINGLYQDENGLLWIGTKEGVKYYDGSRVYPLNVPGMNNWIASNLVPTVCGDGRGHIYINTDFNIVEYSLHDNSVRTIFSQENTAIPPALAFHWGQDALWVGINDSIFVYRNEAARLFSTLGDPEAEVSTVYASEAKIFAGTRNRGLFSIDRRTWEINHVARCSEVISIFRDDEGNVWWGTYSDGAYCLSPGGTITNYRQTDSTFPLSSNYVRTICQDTRGNIWLGTFNGLDVIDRPSGTVTGYGLSENGKKGLSNLSIWAMLRDRQGTMWLGTYYGGLDYCNLETDRFRHHDFGLSAGNGYSVVSAIAEDRRGDLWLGTESNGLLYMDGAMKGFRFMNDYPFSRYNIKSLYYDPEVDLLWIGTHQGGLFRYDIAAGGCTQYAINPADATSRSESVHDIEPFGDGLLLGTLHGVYRLDLGNMAVSPVEPLAHYIFEANKLLVTDDGQVWVAGNDLCRWDPRTDTVTRFGLEPALGGEKFASTALYRDAQGNICVGTAGFGLLVIDPSTGAICRYTGENCDLAGDYVGAVLQTRDGNFLVGTNNGLSYLDTENMRSYIFNSANGFPLHSMLPGCALRKADTGEIILGGINGMAVTSESKILSENLPFDLFLSNLYVNNKLVVAGDETGILSRRFMFTDAITLKYGENNIAIEVGTDNLAGFGQPLHQYRLEGFDRQWITYDPALPVRYMNLPYGRYVFRARAQPFGSGQAREITLGITVRPPLYARWYAYVFYVVLSALTAGWMIYFYRSRFLLRASLEMERKEKEQSEAMNRSKLRFFGNVSHELRTPLTLLMAQLELILGGGNLSDEERRKIGEVYDSSRKMGTLVNELLDFMKFDHGEFRLKVSRGEIVSFVSEVCNSFSALARQRGIDFRLRAETAGQHLLFDKVQMLKVFNNLLGNAFKYTPSGGAITVTVKTGQGWVTVAVEDNGIGIPEPLMEKIFERFYQVDNRINHELSQTGTGIGLSLTRHIVEAHHGRIRVSGSDGGGSVFEVYLSCDPRLFDGDPGVDIIATESTHAPDSVAPAEIMEEFESLHDGTGSRSYSILIVEDDAELLKTLVRIFEPVFNVYEAPDGGKGLELVRRYLPDIVLSDVMMPVMPGDEFCRRVKADFETSHIPVVLLTALDSVEHNIRGLNCGADDYVTKPFNVKLLVTRCFNILNNRRLMQEKFSRHEDISPEAITTGAIDRQFIERVIAIVEENVTSGNLSVTMLCDRLGMSRTKLFNKIKGITGQSPNEFIRSIRLKTAARMLKDRADLNISDIAYMLGFSSLNYFGKYFRTAFGVSPSAYRARARADIQE